MPPVLIPDTLVPAEEPTFYFVGVTTGSSSIMTVFPEWAEHLGIPKRIVGIDVPLDAAPEVYRRVVSFLKDVVGSGRPFALVYNEALRPELA